MENEVQRDERVGSKLSLRSLMMIHTITTMVWRYVPRGAGLASLWADRPSKLMRSARTGV